MWVAEFGRAKEQEEWILVLPWVGSLVAAMLLSKMALHFKME